jgi:hypothetical protein
MHRFVTKKKKTSGLTVPTMHTWPNTCQKSVISRGRSFGRFVAVRSDSSHASHCACKRVILPCTSCWERTRLIHLSCQQAPSFAFLHVQHWCLPFYTRSRSRERRLSPASWPPARPSVRIYQSGCRWSDVRELWLCKSVEKFQIWLKSGKNIENFEDPSTPHCCGGTKWP